MEPTPDYNSYKNKTRFLGYVIIASFIAVLVVGFLWIYISAEKVKQIDQQLLVKDSELKVMSATIAELNMQKDAIDSSIIKLTKDSAKIFIAYTALAKLYQEEEKNKGMLLLENEMIKKTFAIKIDSLKAAEQNLANTRKLNAQLQENAEEYTKIIEANKKYISELDKLRSAKEDSLNLYLQQLKKQSSYIDAVSSKNKIATSIKPYATSVALGRKNAAGLALYKFTLGIEKAPANISKVTYNFNSNTFANPLMTSTNAQQKFEVQYEGWGCLPFVTITLAGKDGRTEDVVFNMCNEVNSGIPSKQTIPSKGE